MELLRKGASQLGIQLTDEQLERFRIYARELIEWNQRFNLTAISDPDQIELKHFLDSLTVLLVWRPRGSRAVIDVGSGAGFPGIPLKIVCPGIRLTLLEATAKKVAFLEHMITLLKLSETRTVQGRAEEAGRNPAHREQYDLALARAVAWLPELLEYGLPFIKPGGMMIAHKGAVAQQEAHAAEHALAVLGGRLERLVPIEIPGVSETRELVVITKVARTPASYPRRPGMPHKRPLGSRPGEALPSEEE